MQTVLAVTPAHVLDPQIAIAASRAGELGILDLGMRDDTSGVAAAIGQLREKAGTAGRWGVRWDTLGAKARGLERLAELLPCSVPVLVLGGLAIEEAVRLFPAAKRLAEQVFFEVSDGKAALKAQAAGYSGLIVKGHEAGGWVGKSSSFILLQELREQITIPYWIQGGICPHSAGAAMLAGAAGVVLAEQLWLTQEGPYFSQGQSAGWGQLDGSETAAAGEGAKLFRVSNRHGRGKLREIELAAARGSGWQEVLQSLLTEPVDPLIPLGQDIAFAADLGRRHFTAGGVITALKGATRTSLSQARNERCLGPGSPIANLHKTRFPIVQGPMTRVSDVAPFALAVAQAGALPFVALAVLPGPQARKVLIKTKELMGERPWGAGILGFLPLGLRQEQMEAISEVKPPFAIIAGGRPSQARELEALGITTYLHVPSPGLLQTFLKEGARNFVFEGNECGGHTGPRTSLILWGLAIETLINAEIKDPESVQVLFAGGIHDAWSAAMVSVLATPICARGMKVGVLMGTAYLFTEEAVRTGAIVQEFQDQAIACQETALLQSGIGIFTRCAKTSFCEEFDHARRELLLKSKPDDQVLLELEKLNIGRLRIASKGVSHSAERAANDGSGPYASVDVEVQRREGLYMMGEAARLRSSRITIAELHEAISIGATEVLERREAKHQSATSSKPRKSREPIAVVGMSCLLPGANGLRSYWQNILLGVDAIREVPQGRWRLEDFFDPKRGVKDKVYSKWGGFLGDIAFDPARYGIPPASLRSIEPVQLLALHVASKALEDAGLDHRPFARERTATIFAVSGVNDLGMDYIFRSLLAHYLPKAEGLSEDIRKRILDSLYEHALPKWTEDSFPGTLDNVVAGRVANRLDLRGANFTVDAACAASLAALDAGIRQLRSGDADVALVGAVDGTNSAAGFMSFAQTHALSPRGRCRPFDDGADGIAISEGVAAVVLKRLADAERDGDTIYAVIRGIGSSSDGHNRSLTAPHPEGQVLAIRRAYEDACIDPATVTLIEAHGTGTVAGDKSEIESLNLAFGPASAARQYCAIGSVKSMIGHTKTAAGLAALVKACLALKHRVLPPTLGVERPTSKIDFTKTPFYINTEPRPWFGSPGTGPHRCGVSAFGFGGTNFHTVLEEYRGGYRPADAQNMNPRLAEILAFARPARAEIEQAARELLQALIYPEHLDLAQLAYSAYRDEARRRPKNGAQTCRLAIVASSAADLKGKLEFFLGECRDRASVKTPQGIYFQEQVDRQDCGALCVLFPGQGSQRINMLRDLVLLDPSLYALFEHADALLDGLLEQPLSRYIYPLPGFTNEERQRQQAELNNTHVAQPALGVAGLAALDLLKKFGLQPSFVAGHSYGEYVALCAAGAISRDDLIRLSEIRGRIAAQVQSGTMAAVSAGEAQVAEAITRLGLAVSVANINAPDQTIVAGPVDAVEAAVKALSQESMRVRRVAVTAAFHCGEMAAAQQALAAELAKVEFHRPQTSLYSNTTGDQYPDDPREIRALLARQIAEPLRFVDEVRQLYAAGARVFIEGGPGLVLSGLVDRILDRHPHVTLGIDTPERDGSLQLAHLLAQVFALGLPVNLDPWFGGRGLAEISLEQTVEQGRAKADPGPRAWRVNAARAVPWHEAAKVTGPKPMITPEEQGGAAGKMSDRSGINRAAVEGADRTTALARSSNSRVELERKLAVSNHESSSKTTGPGAANALGLDIFAHVQGSLSQLIELQREQQETFRRFLSFQERWLAGESKEPADASRPALIKAPVQHISAASPSNAFVPPAPVLPKFVARDANSQDAAAHSKPSFVTPAAVAPSAPAPTATNSGKIENTANGANFPPTGQFKADLLSAVAERTGYTDDMLDPDALMEADLGIDSIKRIEIFSKLKDKYPFMEGRAEETVFEELAGLKTLNAIIQWYDGLRGTLASSGGTEPGKKSQTPSPFLSKAVESNEIKTGPEEVQRFSVTPVPAPRECSEEMKNFPRDRLILLIGQVPILSAAFQDALGAKHFRVRQIIAGSGTRVLDENRIEVDYSSLETIGKLPAVLASLGEKAGAIFNLAGLGDIGDPGGDQHLGYARRLFLLLKVLEMDLKESARAGGGWLINLTAFDGQFGLRKERPFSTIHAGTLGIAKSVAIEWPGVRVKCIDVDPAIGSERLVSEVLQEAGYDDQTIEVGFTSKERWKLNLKNGEPDAVDLSDLGLNSDSVLLVTGGAYGITADVTRALAEKYKPHLVLVGRSPMPGEEPQSTRDLIEPQQLRRHFIKDLRAQDPKITPAEIDRNIRRVLKDRQIRANLAAMRSAGAGVEYHTLDVRDGDALGHLIDAVYERWGRIDGVLHGAGIIDDKLIQDKSPESFEAVFRTKVTPATILATKLRPEGLKFLFFFSSIAGRFGNAGQCDYSAANEVLNKIAARLSHDWPHVHTLAINWGPWDGGMVTDELRRLYATKGIHPVPVEKGKQFCLEEIGRGSCGTSEIVVAASLQRIAKIASRQLA